MEISCTEDKYHLMFQHDPDTIAWCKGLQGSRYNPRLREWTADRNVPNAIDLQRAGHYVDREMLEQRSKLVTGDHVLTLDCKPYPHQVKWAAWGQRNKCLLAAEMGLGKTLMAMQWMCALGIDPRDTIVVCPISLIPHWVEEFKKFTGIEAIPVIGTTKQRLDVMGKEGAHIVNYEFITLNTTATKLAQSKTCIVLDESHKIKSPRARRSKAIHKLAAKATSVLLLTGTPVSQGAHDYYSQMRAVNLKILGSSFTAFRHRYCLEEQVRGAPVGVRKIVGYQNLDELARLLSPYVYTIKKADVMELPEKVYTKRYVELTPEQMKKYREMKYEMITWLKDGTEMTGANILTRLIRFSQITQGFMAIENADGKKMVEMFPKNPKLNCLMEIMEETAPKEPVIIMCRFRQDITNVCEKLEKAGITYDQIHGGIKPIERNITVNNFRRGDFKVLVGQLRVAGVGFNMEHCKKMVFYSNEYSLVDRYQAEDRIHRATSVGSPCVYIDIVATDTIDEHVLLALRNKKDVANQIYNLQRDVLGDI